MTEQNILSPCPGCGSKDVYSNRANFFVNCRDCSFQAFRSDWVKPRPTGDAQILIDVIKEHIWFIENFQYGKTKLSEPFECKFKRALDFYEKSKGKADEREKTQSPDFEPGIVLDTPEQNAVAPDDKSVNSNNFHPATSYEFFNVRQRVKELEDALKNLLDAETGVAMRFKTEKHRAEAEEKRETAFKVLSDGEAVEDKK